MSARGLMIAAPSSGSGKTTITLGLLRALRDYGLDISGAKSGPDYIDPRFHERSSGTTAYNLDAFAMDPPLIQRLAQQGRSHVLIEAAMGLFDGAANGRGSAAELAQILQCPVLLVVDCARMAQSVRAIVRGFIHEPNGPKIAGLILNNVGSPRHETLLCDALTAPDLPPVLGAIPRNAAIRLPSRHLGLLQACEVEGLESFIADVAQHVAQHVALEQIADLFAPMASSDGPKIPPPAQHIAMADDACFAFSYPHLLADWRAQGAQVSRFSPLNDEPAPDADLIYLPGGYPELYAGQLSSNHTFIKSIKNASQNSDIFGECGGYMTLGEGLIDKQGKRHQMLGLLPLDTSFENPHLHLGYRCATVHSGPFAGNWNAHEFHYAQTLRAQGQPLLDAHDAAGAPLGSLGLQSGRVGGSFIHLIAPRQERP